MKTLYQVVGANIDEFLLSREELLARFAEAAAPAVQSHLRPELQNQPALKGLCGPMWGGWRNDEGQSVFLEDDNDLTSVTSYSAKGPIAAVVIRYETWATYERMSR